MIAVSDVTADRAAASMDVSVGSFSDPDGIPGRHRAPDLARVRDANQSSAMEFFRSVKRIRTLPSPFAHARHVSRTSRMRPAAARQGWRTFWSTCSSWGRRSTPTRTSTAPSSPSTAAGPSRCAPTRPAPPRNVARCTLRSARRSLAHPCPPPPPPRTGRRALVRAWYKRGPVFLCVILRSHLHLRLARRRVASQVQRLHGVGEHKLPLRPAASLLRGGPRQVTPPRRFDQFADRLVGLTSCQLPSRFD